jgi:GTP-binding protein
MFVDRVRIDLIAGRGGDGCVSFRREKYVPLGGPDGGDGGDGGSIVIVARDGVNSLSEFAHRKFWRAPAGTHGSGALKQGRSGEDMTLYVPPGTLIIDPDADFVIKDLRVAGDSVVICRGGKGGRGNASFKSSTNRAPREAQRGAEGESRQVILELKSIADVGLIGMPNAGKSTMLSRLSRARPEIADYPFTTKRPNLGRVRVDRDRSFILADIPGLIEGASSGVGLGHDFLRHVERAGLLVHLVEPAPRDGSDPIENYRAIRHELAEYRQELAARPELVAVTKAELPEAADLHARLTEALGQPVFLVSAITGQGLRQLLEAITARLDEDRLLAESRGETAESSTASVVESPTPKPVRVPPHKAGPLADRDPRHPEASPED